MIGVAFGKRVSLTLCYSQPVRAQPVYEQTTASLDLIFYVLVCAGVQTGVSYRVLAMIPHSAARLCNTVVTVLGGNVVLR